MDKFIQDLFKGEEDWRLISFIDKMEDFKRDCFTNQQEEFIRGGLHAAKALLQRREAVRLHENKLPAAV